MTLKFILSIVLVSNLSAQVCCSPVGSGQAGGGISMNNWNVHWPNILLGDQYWHWMSDLEFAGRGPAENIQYGPQYSLVTELSKSLGFRNVIFLRGSVGAGKLEEKITYQNSETLAFSGRFSLGIRRAMGNRGRGFSQFQFTLPGSTKYSNESFPFDSEEAIQMDFLILYNHSLPWSESHPEFLSVLSMTGQYQNNLTNRNNILSDHRVSLHISSTVHFWYPLFLAPFVQMQAEELLAPPSIWTSNRDRRILSTTFTGVDIAFSKPIWEMFRLRLGIPVIAWSSSNGFPDGTQPAAYIILAITFSGIISDG